MYASLTFRMQITCSTASTLLLVHPGVHFDEYIPKLLCWRLENQMENIENRLNDYRVKKRRRARMQQIKESIRNFFMLGVMEQKAADRTPVDLHVVLESEDDRPSILSDTDNDDECEGFGGKGNRLDDRVSTGEVILKYTLWMVYLAFWITLYVIAIELQFGIVFLMLSALVAIYLNTRTGPKKHDEVSAYSVFNKNCISIDGTLKAEQFEREIGIR